MAKKKAKTVSKRTRGARKPVKKIVRRKIKKPVKKKIVRRKPKAKKRIVRKKPVKRKIKRAVKRKIKRKPKPRKRVVKRKPVKRKIIRRKIRRIRRKIIKPKARVVTGTKIVEKEVFPAEKLAELISRITPAVEKAEPCKTSDEETALNILSIYFSEVARLGLKRSLDLDEIINSYFYVLARIKREDFETREIIDAVKKSKIKKAEY